MSFFRRIPIYLTEYVYLNESFSVNVNLLPLQMRTRGREPFTMMSLLMLSLLMLLLLLLKMMVVVIVPHTHRPPPLALLGGRAVAQHVRQRLRPRPLHAEIIRRRWLLQESGTLLSPSNWDFLLT